MRELMTKNSPDLLIRPEPIVPICPDSQLDRLACIDIQAEELWMLVRRELSEDTNRKPMLLHDVPNRRIVREFGEETARRGRIGKVCEGLDPVEGIRRRGGRGW